MQIDGSWKTDINFLIALGTLLWNQLIVDAFTNVYTVSPKGAVLHL